MTAVSLQQCIDKITSDTFSFYWARFERHRNFIQCRLRIGNETLSHFDESLVALCYAGGHVREQAFGYGDRGSNDGELGFLDAFLSRLRGENEFTWQKAQQILANMRPAVFGEPFVDSTLEAIHVVRDDLDSPDLEQSWLWLERTMDLLEVLQHTHTEAILPHLVECLQSKSERVREYAIQAIGNLGPEAGRQALPELMELLRDSLEGNSDDDPLVLAGTIARVGTVPKEIEWALPKLFERAADALTPLGLGYYDPLGLCDLIKWMGTDHINRILPSAIDLLRRYRTRLDEGDGAIAIYSFVKTILWEADAREVQRFLPHLFEIVEDGLCTFGDSICGVIGEVSRNVGAEWAKYRLLRLSRESDASIRSMAAEGLGPLCHSGAEDVLTRLIELLQDTDLKVRESAALSLSAHRSDDRVIRQLPAILRNCSGISDRTIDHLILCWERSPNGRFADGNLSQIKPRLFELLDDPDPVVRLNTIRVVGRLGFVPPREKLYRLIELLEHREMLRYPDEITFVAIIFEIGLDALEEAWPQILNLRRNALTSGLDAELQRRGIRIFRVSSRLWDIYRYDEPLSVSELSMGRLPRWRATKRRYGRLFQALLRHGASSPRSV